MKLLLVDGHGLAYRSYFAMIRNPLSNKRGENTSAEFGFIRALLALRRDEQPDAVLVCFDPVGKSFRHEMDPLYKAGRPKMPEDLRASMRRIMEFLDLAGIGRLQMEGFEADDVLATATRRAEAEGWEVVIHSGDKDLCQLAGERVSILKPGSGRKPTRRMGPAEVEEEMGVLPLRILDLLSLAGDNSDNIPGVKGLGPKGAVKLLKEHGSLDAVLEAIPGISAKGLRAKLEAGREEALRSRELVRLREDLDLPGEPEDWVPREGDPEGLREWLMDRGFQSLMSAFEEGGEPSVEIDYGLIQDEAALDEVIARIRKAGRFAVDTETTGLNPLRAELVGISLAWAEGRACYLPREGFCFGEGLSLELMRKKLGPLLVDEGLVKIAQNLKYDAHVLERHGLSLDGPQVDSMLLSYCLEPGRRSHGLDGLALELFAHEMIPYNSLFEKGDREKDIRSVPVERLCAYAAEDADFTLRLADFMEPQLGEAGAERLFRDVEMPLVPVLARMEKAGLALDLPYLEELSVGMGEELEQLATKIHAEAGREFSIASPKQLSAILFDEMGIPPKKKTKTGYSTDEEVLSELAEEHAIAALVLRWRETSKLKSTYVDALPRQVNPETGRVHTSFQQAVAATGRLSSSAPNLQNIPIRRKQGAQIRRAFIAPPGRLLASFDYSQVELRILAHLSEDEALREAFERDRDIHRWTAARILGKDEDAIDRAERDRAKVVNYGVLYGMGARGMAQRMGITREEAQSFIDEYFGAFPGIRQWTGMLLERARQDGYVSTLLGRRRALPEIGSRNGRLRGFAERAAVNSPIQGSAADIIKLAMLQVDERLAREFPGAAMLLQVHDELLFEVDEADLETLAAAVVEIMEGVVRLAVPLKVDWGSGQNWLEAH